MIDQPSNKLEWEALNIDGKAFSERLCNKIKQEVTRLAKKNVKPGLAVILVGDDPASKVYVNSKSKKIEELGMHSVQYNLDAKISQQILISKIEQLNNNPSIHGILVQLPLPKHIDEKAVIEAIDPAKDVDGFHPINVGKLSLGQDSFVPCTPLGCMILLKAVLKNLVGKKAVIIGRSNIVGKPIAQLLLKENCTVTITHSKTKNINKEVRQADIVIAAVGSPQLVKSDWVKPGAIVIDVGINRISLNDGKSMIIGDVDYPNVRKIAGAVTPVPGGVGPMTIACLMYNTLKAAAISRGIELEEIF